MKARQFLAVALILAPIATQAGDPPSARARAERQRTIEKKAARQATGRSKVSLRNAEITAVRRQQEAVDATLAAAEQTRLDRQRAFDMAMQAGMIEAYRTNPLLPGGGGFGVSGGFQGPVLGVYNPLNSAVYLNVPGAGGAQVGVVSTGQGVSLVPAPKNSNPVGINR